MKKSVDVQPPFWWCGMKYNVLDLLIFAPSIKGSTVKVDYPGLKIISVIEPDSTNYLIVRINISKTAKEGTVIFNIENENKNTETFNFNLYTRQKINNQHQGFSSADVFYLIMPDRFAQKGEINCTNSYEKINRNDPNGRHGGNIEGIRANLDYFVELGVTTLWLNPVQENNSKTGSYHGYAISDFYKVDERFGTNHDYCAFVNDCHTKKLKVVMDIVLNHCSTSHRFFTDSPFKSWINSSSKYPKSNFRISTISDTYSSKYDRDAMVKGWFDASMPDLNASNELLQNYLIQNTLWWIEVSKIDGIRLDTQPYSDKEFVARWAKTIFEEYPNFNIVGESWVPYPSLTAFWQADFPSPDKISSNIPCVADFPLHDAISCAFTENDAMFGGLERLYHVLAQDFLYPNAYNNLIFLDNHDVERFFTSINYNLAVYKMALSFLLTTRGIPQIYYGTEILAEGYKNEGDGMLRYDFPGGFSGDKTNAFSGQGLSVEQMEAYSFTRFLLNWRKNNDAVRFGKLVHFVPEYGFYVYFRIHKDETIMVVINNRNSRNLSTKKFESEIQSYKYAYFYNIQTRENQNIGSDIRIPAKTACIFELKK